MKKIEALTIQERMIAKILLKFGKFNVDELADIILDIKKFEPTDEEWATAERKSVPTDEEWEALTPEQRVSIERRWIWDDEKVIKDIELQKGTVDALLGVIQQKSDAKEFGVGDEAVLSLKKKLTA